MPTEASVQIQPVELTQIVEAVFAAMLELEVTAGDVPEVPGTDRLTAAIQLAGGWNGAILLECGGLQARRFTGRFLSSEPRAAADDVVCDMLGELVNMIGGNLKAVLTPGIHLGMPTVMEADRGVPLERMEVRERLSFQSSDGPFWVSVLVPLGASERH
jgi:chemotaxis protein CheX